MSDLLYQPIIDPLNPQHAYFIGFVVGDGYMSYTTHDPSRRKSRVMIEIDERDRKILDVFVSIFPEATIRTRSRNVTMKGKIYNRNYCKFTISRMDFCKRLNEIGVPYGRKGSIASVPVEPYSEQDFWRGILDANGSVGLTGTGLPFATLVTDSDSLAESYKNFVFEITGYRPRVNRNERDDIYNIAVSREKSQALISCLYYSGCLCLDRKLDRAKEVIGWARPGNMVVRGDEHFYWTKDAEDYLCSHSIRETMSFLGIGYNAVIARRSRLRKSGEEVVGMSRQGHRAQSELVEVVAILEPKVVVMGGGVKVDDGD